jgi:PTH1 family peptidyl-tRNA hydrolase
MIKLIVGLGNPGQQYEQTRHNAGFVFLDHLLSTCSGNWVVNSQCHGHSATCSVAGSKLVLLKPMTFMNRSGQSVGALMRYFKFAPEELLVVHDELDLPEGVVKLKRDGGHAGHNGLRDIIAHIDSRDFYRLRMGIGRPNPGANVADYVLSKPSKAGLVLLEEICFNVTNHMDMLLSGKVAELNGLAELSRK